MIKETEVSRTHELKGQTLVCSAIFRKFPQRYLLTLALNLIWASTKRTVMLKWRQILERGTDKKLLRDDSADFLSKGTKKNKNLKKNH